jgi:radical SAM protein with 4Fe4S-binding SPASM domain
MADRNQVDNISSVKLTDIEAVLAEEFGDRFRAYRIDYRKSMNYDKNGFVPDFPLTVSFELVNRCNLKCVMCYTDHHTFAKKTLAIGTLESVLRECQENGLPAAVIGMAAESLLYKDIRRVIEATREAGVMDVFLGTNATLLTPEMSEFLVDQRVARVEVSLDAATPETYKAIRSKDELPLVEQNVRALAEAKRRKSSQLPVIRLCFCVQPQNVSERQAFIDKWQDLVDYIDFQEMIDFEHVTPLVEGRPEDVPNVESLAPEPYCPYPFNSLHVWADGTVTPCCTYYGKALPIGNVEKDTLADVWQGEKLEAIRDEFRQNKLNPVCRVCLSARDTENFSKAKSLSREIPVAATADTSGD